MAESERRAYTIPEVAKLIGCGVSLVRKHIDDNNLSVKYLSGQKPIVLSGEIDRFLAALPSERHDSWRTT